MENQNEGQKNAGNQQAQATQNINDGLKPQIPEAVRMATEISQKLDGQIKALDERLAKLGEFSANKILGGASFAGEPTPQVIEETPKQYVERIMREGYPDRKKK